MVKGLRLLVLGIFLLIVSVTQLYAAGYSFTTIDYPGADRTEVYGINDSGQIVGEYGGSYGYHGFLATPVPAPASLLLLGTGVVSLLGIGRSKKGRCAKVR